ncbi:MAG TPA: hypothetical protein VN366_06750 [Feifaniaceae bacterium]|nr:hypothetical protein [Feifaniaceae bacterium]
MGEADSVAKPPSIPKEILREKHLADAHMEQSEKRINKINELKRERGLFLYASLRYRRPIDEFAMKYIIPFWVVLAVVLLLSWYIGRQKRIQNITPLYETFSLSFNQKVKRIALILPLVLIPMLLMESRI